MFGEGWTAHAESVSGLGFCVLVSIMTGDTVFKTQFSEEALPTKRTMDFKGPGSGTETIPSDWMKRSWGNSLQGLWSNPLNVSLFHESASGFPRFLKSFGFRDFRSSNLPGGSIMPSRIFRNIRQAMPLTTYFSLSCFRFSVLDFMF